MAKRIICNIIYPSIVNPVDGYLDSRISRSYVIYIITKKKKIKYKTKMIKRSGGGDVQRLFKK